MKRSEPRNPRDIESRDGIRLAVAACLLGGAVFAQSSATAAQDAARSFSMNAIRDQCIEFREVKQGNGPVNYRECRVSEFGEFGAVGGQVYYYAIYCLMPTETTDNGTCGDDSFSARYHRARGLAVFARDPAGENARLMFDRADIEIGTVYYLKPAIIQNAAGALLHLPIAVDGTSGGNLSEYLPPRSRQVGADRVREVFCRPVEAAASRGPNLERRLAGPAHDAGRGRLVSGRRRELLSHWRHRQDSTCDPSETIRSRFGGCYSVASVTGILWLADI